MSTKTIIRQSPIHGKGVYAIRDIDKDEVIAISHVTLLHHNEQLPEAIATLEFPWDDEYYALCLSDVGSFFNHSNEPNAKVITQDVQQLTQTFAATRAISAGEEIMIYYNSDFEEYVSSLGAAN